MATRYLTTTLPYVNSDPHIGFAQEIVQADVCARVWRAQGDDVFFSTGTDEHGQKIFDAATKRGQEAQAYVDHYAAEFQQLKQSLDLSYDSFIRTTDPLHVAAAQEIWTRCEANGDIYKKSYTGVYCVGCEMFKTEKELVEGKCPLHPNLAPETISEENYFFRFSKYQDQLLAYLEKLGVILPEWRRDEAIAFVQSGLEDFSISRETKRLSWGVPVPGDDTQVMYVWFDALTSYISILGWPDDREGNFKKYWQDGTTLQVAGKDQIRFQSLMWQAMLLSANIKMTDQIFYHGFITSGGQKMSKSLGNVINPLDLVAKYGTDAVRYILLRHVSPADDSDLTLAAIHEHYTAHLTNGLGNLVARVMKLATDHLDTPVILERAQPDAVYTDAIAQFQFTKALDVIWARIQALDERIATEKPFAVIKTDPEEGKKMIRDCVSELGHIAYLLATALPQTSGKIVTAIAANTKPDNLFPRLAA